MLKEADIVVTNPPFSLFREFIALMMKHDKEFIVVGNMNAITYKEVFPLIKENKLWLGVNKVAEFIQPDGTTKKFGNILWYTNLEHNRRNYPIDLYKRYDRTPEDFPKYDNYDAIEVSKVADIPEDYTGVMGVPITFLGSYNPNQFEILGCRRWAKGPELEAIYRGDRPSVHDDRATLINGKETYDRIFIKNKNPRTESY